MNIYKYILIGSIFFMACHSSKKAQKRSSWNENVDESYAYVYLPDESKPVAFSPCFKGAYYRKVVSSIDNWLGIKGKVILPNLAFDSMRMNPNKPQQYLDVSSIYLGGNMDGQETDIGLAWEIIRDDKGVVSKERMAFRPFLRRTDHHSGQKSIYINAPAVNDYYWYPEDTVFLSVEVLEDGLLHFIVEGSGKKYETDFECSGYTMNGKGDFKRVNAIDQVANEGKSAQPTRTLISNAKWHYTTLIRMQDGKKIDVPMHNGRFTSMLCPDPKFFTVIQSDQEKLNGGETITIYGRP